ncbi:MAG TPA: glycosyltransferase family 4 protein [Polyangia bacterium]|jgi:glycosyltransferase involved in cell wall biosynthesis|nr:glycosyltransferase family 4 protein [Polyangia bacterium]
METTPQRGKRRFAMVTPNFYPRVCGVGDFTVRFSVELRRRGHDVAIFSRHPVEPHPEALDLEAHGVAGKLPTAIARNAMKAIAAWEPTDLVIQYTPQMWDAWRFGSPATLLLAQWARRRGVRVELVAHELFLSYAPRPDLVVAASTLRLQLAALILSCDDVFVTTCTRADMIRTSCRLLGRPAPRVVRVGANALPVARPVTSGPLVAPRLGIFSTAAAGKRFDVVLDAFTEIVRVFPEAHLVLIGYLGSSDQPRVRQILADVARHPAKDRITVTGGLSLPDVARQMARLDVNLFPMETGANTRSSTLPAALGAGVPVVAVRAEETDLDLFRDGENIVFARDMSGRAFAAAALDLLRDPARMAAIGAGGRRLFAEHLSWERVVDQFLEPVAASSRDLTGTVESGTTSHRRSAL